MQKLVIVDVQRRFFDKCLVDNHKANWLGRVRRAARKAEHCLVIVDETNGIADDALVTGTHNAQKQYGGFCRTAIDLGMQDQLHECIAFLAEQSFLGEAVMDDHPAATAAAERWPELVTNMQQEHGGQFFQAVAAEEWVQGLPNGLLSQWDGATIIGGARNQCLAEVELAMRCAGLETKIDESLCYY